MTETTDRQDAVPAAGPTPEAPATLDEQVAVVAVEGDEPELHAEAAEPDEVVATAVLVADEEFVLLPASQPETDAPPELEAYRSDEAPLLDSELEEGIANIFATLHSATDGEGAAEAVDVEVDAGADDDLAAVDMSTFRLLGELDRLWHRAA